MTAPAPPPPDGLDQRAVLRGATASLVVAVPVALLAQVLAAATELDDLAAAGLWLVIMGALVAGGRVAALRRPDQAYVHGAMAALGAYIVLAALAVVRFAVGRETVDVLALVSNAFLAAAAGILGGALALRADRRRRR